MIVFFGSIVALATPLKNGNLDLKSFQGLIQLHHQGLVICGSTGQGMLLSEKERETLICMALETVSCPPILVGCGAPSTEQALTQVLQAQNLKAHGVLLVTPLYSKPSRSGIIHYFQTIHNRTNIPILLYNNPARTGVDLHIEDIATLSQCERIVGIKESSPDPVRPFLLRQTCGENFSVLAGDDVLISSFLLHGANGMISVGGNIDPKTYALLYKAWGDQDFATFKTMNKRTMQLSLTLHAGPNPAAVQQALSLLGRCSDELRSPLTSLSNSFQDAIKETLLNLELVS